MDTNAELSQSMVEPGMAFDGGAPPPRKKRGCIQRLWTAFCGTPCRAILVYMALVLMALIIFTPLILMLITPIVVEMFLDATTMTVINCSLQDPTTTTLIVEVRACSTGTPLDGAFFQHLPAEPVGPLACRRPSSS